MTVIFAFTKHDALWAVQWERRSKNPVKILAPTIAAQLVLRKENFPHHEYFSEDLHRPCNYARRTVLLAKRTYNTTKVFLERFDDSLAVCGVLLKTILTLRFEYEFYATIAAYDLYKNIERAWHPKEYWVPTHPSAGATVGNTDATLYSAFAIAHHFAPAERVRHYQSMNSWPGFVNQWRRLTSIVFPITVATKKILVTGEHLLSDIFRSIHPIHLSSRDILFYSFGYNLDYYHELFKIAKTHGFIHRMHIICGKQPLEAEWLLYVRQIPFIPLRHLIDSGIKRKIRAETQKITRRTSSLTTRTLMQWFPQTTPAPLKRALADKALFIIQSLATQYISQAAVAELAINKIRPKLVITTHDPAPSASPFVALAHKHNINTLLLLHGIIDDSQMGAWFQSKNIQLWGEWMMKHFPSCENRTSPPKLHTTGFPYLDHVFLERKRIQKSSYEYLSSKKPLIFTLLLSQYLPDTFIMSKFLDELFFTLKREHVPVRIAARTHREQSTAGFQELARYYNIQFTFNNYHLLETLIHNSDLVLSMDTTAILWPMIQKKPLFYTTPWWGSGTLPIKEYDAAFIPENAQQLVHKIKQFVRTPSLVTEYYENQQHFLREFVGATTGDSSKKTLDLMKSFLFSTDLK